MFEVVCAFLEEFDDPLQASLILSQPGYFAPLEDGLAINSAHECRIVLCNTDLESFTQFMQIDGTCSIEQGDNYLSGSDSYDRFSYNLGPSFSNDLLDLSEESRIVVAAGRTGLALSIGNAQIDSGLSVVEYEFTTINGSGQSPNGFQFIVYDVSGDPSAELSYALRSTYEAGAEITNLTAFAMYPGAFVGIFGGDAYSVRIPTLPASPAQAVRVAHPQGLRFDASLRGLARVACYTEQADFAWILVNLYRYDSSMERLNDDCT